MELDFMFPMNEKELERMEWVVSNGTEGELQCFGWFALDCERDPYVDLYIWDAQQFEKAYIRFVISEKIYLDAERERLLHYYAKLGCVYMSVVEHDILFEKAKKLYPDMKLGYCKGLPLQLLLHIYYATHWAYPEEKFYKCGLITIATHLNQIENINQEGKNPGAILGVPIRLLRFLNTKDGVEYVLKAGEKRKKLADTYKKYPDIFPEKTISLSMGQCMYLSKLIEQEEIDIKEERAILANLENCNTTRCFEKHCRFLEIRKKLKEYSINIPLEVGDSYDESMDFRLYNILRNINRIEEIDERFGEIRQENFEYEYKTDKYLIRFPLNFKDLVKASQILNNCLSSYVDMLCNRCTHVMLVIDNKTKKTVAAIEINMNSKKIVTALGKCNLPINADVAKVLDVFVKAKKMKKMGGID